MKPRRALAVLHSSSDVPGTLPEVLAERGIELETMVVTQPLPDPEELEMVVVMGSPESAYDHSLPWLEAELAWLERVVAAGLPVFGICFGSQLLARAMGGSALAADEAEIGWTPITARQSSWDHPGPWLNFHFDTFRLPDHVTLLASTDRAPQAFRSGSAWGVQFHPEITVEMFDTWLSDWRRSQEGRQFLAEAGDLPQRLRNEIDRRHHENYLNFSRLVDDFLAAIQVPAKEMT